MLKRLSERIRFKLLFKLTELQLQDPMACAIFHGIQRIFWNDWKRKKYRCYFLIGGFRSGKTFIAAMAVIWDAIKKALKIYGVTVTDDFSKDVMQPAINTFLPQRYKDPKHYSYDDKTGISGAAATWKADDGGTSKLQCHTQGQKLDSVQGFEADLIWHDEENDYETVMAYQARQITRGGYTIVSTVARKGMTKLLRKVFHRKRTIARRFAPLLNREVPVVEESDWQGGTGIYYLWLTDNPHNSKEGVEDYIASLTPEEIEVEVYGLPKRQEGAMFSTFNWEHNVKSYAEVVSEDRLVNVVDNHGSRPWAMGWGWINDKYDKPQYHIVREWPEFEYHGVVNKGEWGFSDYARTIKAIDDDIRGGYPLRDIKRLMDPKAGNTPHTGDYNTQTIQEIMRKFDLNFSLAPVGGPDSLEPGYELLREIIKVPNEYDGKSPENDVRLTIDPCCANFIEALTNHNHKDPDEWKDFVDLIRFLVEFGEAHRNPWHRHELAMRKKKFVLNSRFAWKA